MTHVDLTPVSEQEFPTFIDAVYRAYVIERAEAYGVSIETAERTAREQHDQLLPQGVHTPGHTFVWLQAGESKETVGLAWWRVEADTREAYLFYIWVHGPHRRRGYASQALAAIERDCRAQGAERLGLNVFAPNEGAIRLYRKAGLQMSAIFMSKRI